MCPPAIAIRAAALFTVAVHRRFAVAGPVAAGYALVPFLTLVVRPDIAPAPWWQVVLGVVCVAAVLAWGMFVRARRQSVRERARRVESEQELRVAQVRQSERDRIAREMHDVLAHRLSLLSLHAGALELRPDAAPQQPYPDRPARPRRRPDRLILAKPSPHVTGAERQSPEGEHQPLSPARRRA
jgi:signal transduction histidine kinase